jgi:hypothetical protein
MISPAYENERLAAALNYAERHSFAVFPCHTFVDGTCTCRDQDKCTSPGKHPLTANGCKDGTSDLATIREWWRQAPEANIGITTGADSGVFVVDLDGAEGIEALYELEKANDLLPETVCAETGSGGRHYYFQWPGLDIRSMAHIGGKRIDVRGTGGLVVAAPSVSGKGSYRWIASPDEQAIAPAPQWLLDWILSHQPSRDEAEPRCNGDDGRAYPSDPEEDLALAESALSALDPDAGRDEWVKIGMCLHQIDPSERGYLVFDGWSKRGSKYKGPTDTRKRWDSYTKGSVGFGANVGAGTLFALAKSHGWERPTIKIKGVKPAAIRNAGETFPSVPHVQDHDSSGEILFPVLSTRNLIDTAIEPEYLIPGALVKGQHGFLGGHFKTLKTSAAADLAIAGASGGMWLGYFKVPRPFRVAFMSAESGANVLAETTTRIAEAAGIDPRRDLENLFWCDRVPKLLNAVHVKELERLIELLQLELLLIDPLYLSLTGVGNDASNVFSMGDALGPIGEIGQRTGCTCILLHHTSKGANRQRGFAPANLDDLAFSGVAEFARQWLLLSRRSEYVPGTGRHELWLVAGGSAGHSGQWALDVDEGEYSPGVPRVWRTKVNTSNDAQDQARAAIEAAKQRKADEELEADKKTVLQAILRTPGQRGTARDIHGRCNRNWNAFQRALMACVDKGDVRPCDIVKGKRTFPGYEIADDSET